eukprot:EG_transcript_14893
MPVITIGDKSYSCNDCDDTEVQHYLSKPQCVVEVATQPMLISFIRHGETKENASGVIQGWSPTDLSDNGFHQAHLCGEWMKIHFRDVRCIFTSDLPRAKSTAEVIQECLGPDVPLQVSPVFRERCLGIFEGKHASVAREYDKDFLQQCSSDSLTLITNYLAEHCPETMIETSSALLLRAKEALRLIFQEGLRLQTSDSSTLPHIVVVSHGLMLRLMVSLISGNPHLLPKDCKDAEKFFSSGISTDFKWTCARLSNTSVTRVILQVQRAADTAAPFFTPATVLTMDSLAHLEPASVLDPACGGE